MFDGATSPARLRDQPVVFSVRVRAWVCFCLRALTMCLFLKWIRSGFGVLLDLHGCVLRLLPCWARVKREGSACNARTSRTCHLLTLVSVIMSNDQQLKVNSLFHDPRIRMESRSATINTSSYSICTFLCISRAHIGLLVWLLADLESLFGETFLLATLVVTP